MRIINKFLVFLVILIYSPASILANITCSINAIPTINFGTINPYDASTDTLNGINIPITCNFTLNVWDSLNAKVYFTPVNPSRTMTNGSGGILPYDLYTNAGYSNLIGTSSPGIFNIADTLGIVVPSRTYTNAYGAGPLYGKIAANLYTVPAGTYTDTIYVNLYWTWSNIFNPPNNGSGGIDAPGPSNIQQAVTVQATVQNTCTVTSGTMAFGTFNKLVPTLATSSGVTVTCTYGATYSVGLGNGSNFSSGRRMSDGVANFLHYGLYADSNRTMNWSNSYLVDTYGGAGGVSPPQTATATGTAQPITIYGLIPVALNASAVAGSYTDTVAIVVYSY